MKKGAPNATPNKRKVIGRKNDTPNKKAAQQAASVPERSKNIYDYKTDAQLLREFFAEFYFFKGDNDDNAMIDDVGEKVFKYKRMMDGIARRDLHKFVLSLDDLQNYSDKTRELCRKFEKNTSRYLELMYEIIDDMLSKNPNLLTPTQFFSEKNKGNKDVLDVLLYHRKQRLEQIKKSASNNTETSENHNTTPISHKTTQPNNNAPQSNNTTPVENSQKEASSNVQQADTTAIPLSLQRRYEIMIEERRNMEILDLRNVKAKHIGKLVKLKGIVTRISDVKPLLLIATYTCQDCGYENYQEVKAKSFMPLFKCGSPICQQRKTGSSLGALQFQTRGSKFLKFQELKIQELPDQVPIGHTPRSVTVHVMGELTRCCAAGDIVLITGIFLPTPFTGWQALKAGLIADTFIQSTRIEKTKKSYAQYESEIRQIEEVKRFAETTTPSDLYDRLSSSIAPEIYGHEDVKRALLLLMIGAPTRVMPDGMKIRGDINVCLMGDPGVAKSQLLKHIAMLAPRGVYTSGKGASGVGLTAAVVRDPTTQEFVLEGGSLVLADMGICCIDEFDKMEEADRTAIHEVMEQQTVSIAKAGINTTLNARTAILAAANPAYGRYNIKRSPAENINLPAALLSRFDLMFLILDKPNYERDLALATHVTMVHIHSATPPSSSNRHPHLSADFIRSYVSVARGFSPHIPEDLTQYIVRTYVNMRQLELTSPEKSSYITARSLLGILRLSQALARLKFLDMVSRDDVDEAIRLIDSSQSSLEDERMKAASQNQKTDPLSTIYDIVRNTAMQLDQITLTYHDLLPRILAKGYTEDQFNRCLDEYEKYEVWKVSSDRRSLTFVG